MRFGNRGQWGSNHRQGSNPPAESVHDHGNQGGRIRGRASESISGLFVWLLLIFAVVGLAAVGFHLRKSGGSVVEREDEDGRPIYSDIVHYSPKFITAVKSSRLDFLSDYGVFCYTWNEVSPNEPMMLQVVRLTTTGPGLARASRTHVIDPNSFGEFRPLLVEIRDLILEGDADGRGKLPQSGYGAEPTEPDPRRVLERRKTK